MKYIIQTLSILHFYVSLQEHIWSWYTILFAWVANGVAYQVLQVANKMLAACVTFFILCCTCLFVYKTSFWWRCEILYRTCWICTFAWGRCPMFGRYVVLDGMCTSDLLLFNLPTVCPHCREWYTFSRLWVMDYIFCQYMKDVDVTIYDRIQTYMIYNWFIHQDRISCFCFMFLIVTLDACKSTNCQGDMDPTSAGKMFDVPKTTSRYLKGWRCRWLVAGRLPSSAAHVQVVDIHEWYPLNKNVSTISTSTGCFFFCLL